MQSREQLLNKGLPMRRDDASCDLAVEKLSHEEVQLTARSIRNMSVRQTAGGMFGTTRSNICIILFFERQEGTDYGKPMQ